MHLSEPPCIDFIGNVPPSDEVLLRLRAYHETARRWGGLEYGDNVVEYLMKRPGAVSVSEAEGWLEDASSLSSALGLGSLVLRAPSLLTCREVARHTDIEAGQQRLVYWVLQNDGYQFGCQGEASCFTVGDVFSFDPGLPHDISVAEPLALDCRVWTGWVVPVMASAYVHWRERLQAFKS